MTATLTLQGDPYFSGRMVPQIQLSESALSRFTGNYHSDEVAATYELSLVKGVLTLKNGNQTPVNLLPVGPNEFQAGDLGTIVFSVTTAHHVTGLTVPTANLMWGRRRPAHTCCKSDVRAIFSENNREAREGHAAIGEQGSLVESGSEN